MQMLAVVAVWLGIQSGAGWGWWVVALLFDLFVYSMVGNNIALHRYFTHGHFTVPVWIERIFVWCGSMVGVGDPVSYAMIHLAHHNPKYTDTNLDPHGPSCGWWSVLIYFHRAIDVSKVSVSPKRLVPIITKYKWLHDYYIPFIVVNAGLLWLISYEVFLFCWFIPATMACWGIGLSVVRQHWPMSPNNTPRHKWDFVHEGLHKNHHDYPTYPNTAVRDNEIDWTYQFSRLFKPKYNKYLNLKAKDE